MSIEHEYMRWKTTTRILNYLKSSTYDSKKKYEIKNILERFLLMSANLKPPDKVYDNLPQDHYIYKNFRRELMEKNIADVEDSEKISLIVGKLIKSYLDSISLIENDANVIVNKSTFMYKDYKYSIPHERLQKYPGDNKVIMCMLLRYSSIISTSQQWSLPYKWYENIVNNFNASVEGFASPLNSQLMLVMPKGKTQFCSLFPDTDKYFGSIGSIFDVNMVELKNKTIVNNPPFVLDIMNKLIKTQNNWLNSIPITIIMSVPAWKDAEYFRDSVNNKYLIYKKKMNPGDHYYESIKDGTRIKILTKFTSYMFVFSNKKLPNVEKITEFWKT